MSHKVHFQAVLLVTAHPDDEAMFFAPTIHRLQQQGAAIQILCLSNGGVGGLTVAPHTPQQQPWEARQQPTVNCCCCAGNGAGLGRVRERELAAAARVLQVASCGV